MAQYDSGGRHRNHKKYFENLKQIFPEDAWPCKQCGNERIKGHKNTCPEHWRNK